MTKDEEDAYENKVQDAVKAMFEAGSAVCRHADGQLDTYMMALACGQIIGSNASLLTSDLAREVIMRAAERCQDTYLSGLELGGPLQ